MGKDIGKNTNTYDDVNAPLAITLNTNTYTKLLDANNKRIGYKISNESSKTIFVKEQGAAIPDSSDRGFVVFARTVYESKPDQIPIGEISAKAISGSPEVLVVEE